MRKIVSIVLLLAVAAPAVWPQKNQKPATKLPAEDPFVIGRGTSFSASVPRSTQTVAGSNPPAEALPHETITRDFKEALEIIRQHHVSGPRLDYNELTKSSIEAMLHALDPHSNYFDAADYQELLTDQQSEYYGIGATIANYVAGGRMETYVVATFPDSPANRAGLRFGDRFVAVDDEPMTGKTSAVVRDKVRGRKGTIVRVRVERADSKKIETIEIRRNRVAQPSIPDAYLLREGVGYVDMSEGFNYTTSEELTAALARLHKQGMKSLILDLRNNTGGILDQAVRVAEKFLPAGSTVVSQRGRFAIDNRVWRASNRAPETMPMVVLVNDSTASASEIVAGALQDYDRALIIGETTFGKGLVQSIFDLPDGSGLTLTTAKYYTPSGRSIQRDYSKGNLYDYYQHKTGDGEPNKPESKTLTGRKVFGGAGITPDEALKTDRLTEAQIRLVDPLFFFATELAAGRVRGFENYRVDGPLRFEKRVRPADYPVTDELLAKFREFVAQTPEWQPLASTLEAEKQYLKTHLRYHLATAAFGSVAANQVMIEDDKQIAKAVASLPQAQQLAQTASRQRQKQNR